MMASVKQPKLIELNNTTAHKEKVDHYDATLQFARTIGGGKGRNGVLSLAIGEAEYKSLTGEEPKPPLTEPVLEKMDDMATGSENTEVRERYKEEYKRYNDQEKAVVTVYEFLTNPFAGNKTMMKKLLPEGDQRHPATAPLKEVIERYYKVICAPKPGELTRAAIKLSSTYYDVGSKQATNADDCLTDYAEEISYLRRFKHNFSEETMSADCAKSFGGRSGPFKDGIKAYYSRPLGDQTVANLLEDIRREMKTLEATSAAETGFAAAVTTADSATAAIIAQQVAEQVAAQIALMFPEGAAAAAMAAAPAGGRGNQGGGAGKGRGKGKGVGGTVDLNAPIPVLRYCWSCGPNQEHDGTACPDPEPGHIKSATRDKPQGGRRKFCPVALRIKFPHQT